MDQLIERARVRFTVLLGIGAVIGLGAAAMLPVFASTPDAGTLEPIVAESAEEVQVEVLSAGQTFGGVLARTPLSANEQYNLLLAFRERANPARLGVGTEITLRYLRGADSIRSVEIAVSKDESVQLRLEPSGWVSALVETPVQLDTIVVSGTIERDLWSAVVMNPVLEEAMPRADRAQVIHYMDRVFQWQLDFSRQIRQGDSYRLVFEREVRPDGSMRTGRILAAQLVNQGTPLNAIWFDLHGDDVGGYYDLEGESLRRAFIRAPLEYRRISSRFNRNRFHPVLNVRRPHIGVDYAASTGTPVMATADGTIISRGPNGGFGNFIEIRHANGFITRYAHLNGFRSGLSVGSRVSQGEVIGYVGMTGLATGPHLHYEMHRNGTAVDPLNIDIPAGDPIPDSARDRWTIELRARRAMLNGEVGSPDVLRIAQGNEPVEDSGSPVQ